MAQEFGVNLQEVFNHIEGEKRNFDRHMASGNMDAAASSRQQISQLEEYVNQVNLTPSHVNTPTPFPIGRQAAMEQYANAADEGLYQAQQRGVPKAQQRVMRAGLNKVVDQIIAPPPYNPQPEPRLMPISSNARSQNGGAAPYDPSVSMRDSVIGQFSQANNVPFGDDGLINEREMQAQFGEETAGLIAGMSPQVRQALSQGARIPIMVKAGGGVRSARNMIGAQKGSMAKAKSHMAMYSDKYTPEQHAAFAKAEEQNDKSMQEALEVQAPMNDSMRDATQTYDAAVKAVSEAQSRASVGAPFSLPAVRGAVQVARQAGQDNLQTIMDVKPNVDVAPIIAKMIADMAPLEAALKGLSQTVGGHEGVDGLEKLVKGIESFGTRVGNLQDRIDADEIKPSTLSPVLLRDSQKNYSDALNSQLGGMNFANMTPEMRDRAKALGAQARGVLNESGAGVDRLGVIRQDYANGKIQSEQDKLDAKAARDADREMSNMMRSAGIMNKQFDKDRDASYQNQYGLANKIGLRLGRADDFYTAGEEARGQGNSLLAKNYDARGDKEMLSLLGRIADILLEIEKLQKTNTNGENDPAIAALTAQKDRIEADGEDILNGKPPRRAAGGRGSTKNPLQAFGQIAGGLGGNTGIIGQVGNLLLGQGGKALMGGLAALGGGASVGMAAAIPAATGAAALGAGVTAVTGGTAAAIGAAMVAAAAAYALGGAGRGDEIAAGRLGEQLGTKGRIIDSLTQNTVTKDGMRLQGGLKEEFIGLGYKREELYGMLSQMGVVGATPDQQAGLALTAGSIARQGGIDLNAVGGLGNQLNNASGRQGTDETQRLFRQFTATMKSGEDSKISGSEMTAIVGAAVEASSKTAGGYLSRDATDSLMGQQQAALKAGGIGGIDRLNRANSFFQNNQSTQDVGLFATNNVMVQAEMQRTGKSFGQVVSPNDKMVAANLDKEYKQNQSSGVDVAMSSGLMSRFTAQSILKMSSDGSNSSVLRTAVMGSGLMSREQYNDGVAKGNLVDMLKDMAAGKKPVGDTPNVANSPQNKNEGYKSALEQQIRMDEITIEASKLVLTNTSTLVIEAQKGTQVALSGTQSLVDETLLGLSPFTDAFGVAIGAFGGFVDQLTKNGGKDGNPFTTTSYRPGDPGTIVGPGGQAMSTGRFNAMYPGYGGVTGSGVQGRYNNAMFSTTTSTPPSTGGGGRVATSPAPYGNVNTSGATRSSSHSGLRADGTLDASFVQNTKDMAGRLGVDYEEVLRIMAFETGGSFSAAQKNAAGSSGTGLIQFMSPTARALGTSTAALGKMSANDQLKYVEMYMKRAGVKPGMDSLDMYLSVLFPAAMGKKDDYVLFGDNAAIAGYRGRGPGSAYAQNRGLDKDGDFNITRREVGASLMNSSHYRNLPKTQVIEVKLSGNVAINGKPSPAAFQIIGQAIAAQIKPSGVSVGTRA